MKYCVNCQRLLGFHKSKYCSDLCKKQYRPLIRKDYKRNILKSISKTCPICKKEFETKFSSKIFCGEICAKVQERKRRLKRGKARVVEVRKCKLCGKDFHPRLEDTRGYKKEINGWYCSRKCAGVVNTINHYKKIGVDAQPRIGGHNYGAFRKLHYGICIICGKYFCHKSKRSTCSDRCAYKVALEQSKAISKLKYVPAQKTKKHCLICNKTYYGFERSKYCSDKCRDVVEKHRNRGYYKSDLRHINRMKVYFMDNGICGICGKRVNLKYKYPHPMSLSLDHIIPKSQGGRDAYSNVQVSHWICNVKLRETGEKQLRLLVC